MKTCPKLNNILVMRTQSAKTMHFMVHSPVWFYLFFVYLRHIIINYDDIGVVIWCFILHYFGDSHSVTYMYGSSEMAVGISNISNVHTGNNDSTRTTWLLENIQVRHKSQLPSNIHTSIFILSNLRQNSKTNNSYRLNNIVT